MRSERQLSRIVPAAPAALAALALALGGCGSSSHPSGTEADPATAVPAAAPAYVGATVRPSGSQQSAAEAAGKGLTGSPDPYARLLGLLRTPGSPPLDYQREVAPWLGPRAGLFAGSLRSAEALIGPLASSLTGSGAIAALQFSSGGLDGALVMDTSDAGAARSFLATQAKRAGAHASSYRGVSYEVSPGGVAFGLVGRFAVIGSEAGLRGVIGATQGEAALSSTPGYAKLASSAPSEAIAHLYVNPAAGAPHGSGQSLLEAIAGSRPTYAALTLASSSLRLDVDSLAGGASGLLAPDPQAAQALSQLPGESWLALGIGHAGTHLAGAAAALSGLSSLTGSESAGGTLSLGGLLGGLTQPLRILGARTPAARRDFASWMGPAGIFAAGSGVLELRAGVVISSTNATSSRAAVAKLGARLRAAGNEVSSATIPGTDAAIAVRLPGLPLILNVASGSSPSGPKFILGLGEASVTTALSPSSTMSASSARSAASSALGEGIEPSVIADFPTLLALLEGVGLTEDPTVSSLLPYLRASKTLVGGGRTLEGGVERFRLVLALRSAGG
ncbi:MAG TPA: DUF3352 domain-containing protein [Solirubrobacteraceae bacterium]|nr:DUF3352 domain-containing protein [Solirubrobacteraceae bacterium]